MQNEKKVYQTPKLIVHGDVAELTRVPTTPTLINSTLTSPRAPPKRI